MCHRQINSQSKEMISLFHMILPFAVLIGGPATPAEAEEVAAALLDC